MRYHSKSSFAAGILNGFLPCGLVYVALSGTVVLTNPMHGFVYMIVFGLGTLPMMIGIVLMRKSPCTIKKQHLIQKSLPIATILFGVWILIRGLGLDIPYLSPDASELDLINFNSEGC